jgi:O-glycosyl hydrolase
MQISSNAQEAISFIPMLHSTIASAGLNTQIACCDPVGWPTAVKYMPNLVSAGMEQYLGVITSHTYSGDATSPLNTKLRTWVTEAGSSPAAFVSTWYSSGSTAEGMTWANKIAQGIVDAKLSAYLYWEGFENGQQQSGSHLVDVTGSNVVVSGIYYAFAMWSRYIRPGAVRLSTSGSISSTRTGVFKNPDGTYVAVFTNSGTSSQSSTLSFSGFTPGSASAYLTDNSHKFASTSVSVSGGQVTVDLPAHSVVTVKMSGSGGGGTPVTTPGDTPGTTTTQGGSTPTGGNGGACSTMYGQCGGIGWTGPKCCSQGSCKVSNEYYSQCL